MYKIMRPIVPLDGESTSVYAYASYITIFLVSFFFPSSERALRRLFDEFDSDNSGFISPSDVRKLINDAGFGDDVSDEEINDRIARVDTTGDGKISFDEFLAVFME